MRMLLKVSIPTDVGNAAIANGSPYFAEHEGLRTGYNNAGPGIEAAVKSFGGK